MYVYHRTVVRIRWVNEYCIQHSTFQVLNSVSHFNDYSWWCYYLEADIAWKKYVIGTQLCGLRDHQGLMQKVSLLIGHGHFLIVILRKTHVCWVKILGVWRARSSPGYHTENGIEILEYSKEVNPIVWGAEDKILHGKHRNLRKCRIFFSEIK